MPERESTSLTRYVDKDNGQLGITVPPGVPPTGTTLAANRGYLVRFVPSRVMRFVSMSFVVTTNASVDDAVDVGIYSAAGFKQVSSGATAGKLITTLGVKTVTFTPYTVTPGNVYYAAFSQGALGGTAAIIMGYTWGNVASWNMFGTTIGLVEGDCKAAVHPLPDDWGALGAATASTPWLALRET